MKNHDPYEPVETARLTLRATRKEDAAAFASLMTPDISRWLAAWPAPLTEEFAAARIVHGVARAEARASMPITIVRRSDSDVLGYFGISCDGERARTAMMGFWLGTAFQRQGYMREALPPAIAAAFAFLDVDVIEAGVQPENTRSRALLAACGMSPTDQRMVFAESRNRDEVCQFYAISRTRR